VGQAGIDNKKGSASAQAGSNVETFWRVEGSLLNLSAVRPVAFFTWNSQRFSERWKRRGGLGLLALFRPFLYATNRVAATRMLHTLLRGVSQDRLDLLGEEYFEYFLKPHLKPEGVKRLKACLERGESVVLVSQGLDHVMRPLAANLGVERLISNRLEFRDGLATGRLLLPVIRPRQALAWLIGHDPDGRVERATLARNLGLSRRPKLLLEAIRPVKRTSTAVVRSTVTYNPNERVSSLSVRQALEGKHVLLIGVTGFIGKVWLAKMLQDLPSIGRVYLLIRRQRSNTSEQRFERIISESPVFESFHEKYGDQLPRFIGDRVEVVEGDITRPGLGLATEVRDRLAENLDLVINSSGLTDFNPDLRQALSINVDGTNNLIDFIRQSRHAAMLHLSTCYVVGGRDGRVVEELQSNYTPNGVAGFDAAQERERLHELVSDLENKAQSEKITAELRQQIQSRHATNSSKPMTAEVLEALIRKNRARWLRAQLTVAGKERAATFGWPNTYTFTKSLAESLIASRAADLPVAIVRPSIVETSTGEPFAGWNEGVNTSAPLSYLLGTYFRQLPSNEKKCLDLIPVDLVCRGMTLISAALVERSAVRLYQLATSASNPCNMRRSIELTGLAHRKHYRAQQDFEYRVRALFDSIPVSKERYQNLSAPRQKALVQTMKRVAGPLAFAQSPLARRERDLDRVEKLIELYEPFILHNEHIFEANNIELLSAALPPDERDTFGYDALVIDWWDYWINIHIPALRKWSYPLIEGRALEQRPRRAFHLPEHATGIRV
jgi:thioester reductase-like protein